MERNPHPEAAALAEEDGLHVGAEVIVDPVGDVVLEQLQHVCAGLGVCIAHALREQLVDLLQVGGLEGADRAAAVAQRAGRWLRLGRHRACCAGSSEPAARRSSGARGGACDCTEAQI